MKLISTIVLVLAVSACSAAPINKQSEKPQLCGSDLVGCQVNK